MFQFRHPTLIVIVGFIWLAIGLVLLLLGIHFLIDMSPALVHAEGSSLVKWLAGKVGSGDNAISLLLAVGLFIGYMKGRYVLGRAAHRIAVRIVALPNPVSLSRVFNKGYYILIASMIGLGMLIKVLGVPPDVRGTIDLAIGSALINGAFIYFRYALTVRRGFPI